MKKITLISSMLMILASCVKKESSFDELQNKKIPADSFFEKVIALNPTTKDCDDAFYIDYNWNSQTNTIEITKVTEKELDFWPYTMTRAEREELRRSNKYKVTCTKGDKDIRTKICDTERSCGSLIKDCLGKDGCATVCANKMVFIPKRKEFFLENE